MNMNDEKIVIRSVFGKTNKYFFNPVRDSRGRYSKWVKPVDHNDNMILTVADEKSPDRPYFLKQTDVIEVTDGTVFNLADPIDRAKWESIEHSPRIARFRNERDANGNLIIDGATTKNYDARYGGADLYVHVPGAEAQSKISRREKIMKANNWILDDSVDGRLTRAKILGKSMRGSSDHDVKDFLYQIADQNPDKIIQLYTGGNMALTLLVVEALEKGVITNRGGLLTFGDSILGRDQDAAIRFLTEASNSSIKSLLVKETNPEYFMVEDEIVDAPPVEAVAPKPKPAPRTTAAKK